MTNDLARADFWRSFVADRCEYPAPDRLRAQLANAEFHDFCECGCNTFAVKANKDARPLVPPHGGRGHRTIYTADFKMADDRTLEIMLLADPNGNLGYIEVDCCANSYPVPQNIEVGPPFRKWASEWLLP